MHLRVSLERLANRYGVEVERRQPLIGYRESIRSKVAVRGRHKKQTGGHGQFGDVALEVEPLPRGTGFEFVDASRAAWCRANTSRPWSMACERR